MRLVRRLVGLAGLGAAFAAAMAVYEQRILIELATTPDPDAGRDFTFPASRAHEIVTPDGGRIHVEECGSGCPVLLLHGHGATLDTFALLARRLAECGCRVVAMDQRGFGRSSSVPPTFDLWGLCDDAATVLDALGLRRAIVVGHSMGGAVALGLAISRPEILSEHVAGLVLINSSARGPADRALTRARAAALDWAVVERLSRDPRHGIVFARKNFGVDARRSHVAAARAIGFDSPVAPAAGLCSSTARDRSDRGTANHQTPGAGVGGFGRSRGAARGIGGDRRADSGCTVRAARGSGPHAADGAQR